MYSLSQLRRGVDAPALFGRELNRRYYRRRSGRPYNTAGVDIFAEDWDVLVLLDACRYDMFAGQNTLPGELTARQSRGSSTREFLRGNVDGKRLHETVYVTASPMLYRNRDSLDGEFHAEVDVWRTGGWDDDSGTVLPETTTAHAVDAAADYPNKRLLVHYLQPHYPFVGSDTDPFTAEQAFDRPDEPDCWDQVLRGELRVDPADVWRAYRATLDRALDSVADLFAAVDGKIVVSADHGNMVGERARPVPVREWGHPHGLYTTELVRVPWLEHTAGVRPRIVAEPPAQDTPAVDEETVTARLRDLGYAE